MFKSPVLLRSILLLACCALILGWCTSVIVAQKAEKADLIAVDDTATCLGCHEEQVNARHLAASAHGTLKCQQCHTGINQFPHPENAVKHPHCNTCHAGNKQSLQRSVHGTAHDAKGHAITCQACHGGNPHEIVKPSRLSTDQQEAACRKCHAGNFTLLSQSIHGNQGAGGKPLACLACHGENPHAIRPPQKTTSAQQNAICLNCHTADMGKMLSSAHGKAITGSGKTLACLTCHGSNAHSISAPNTITAPAKNVMCERCHTANAGMLAGSVHGNTDMQGSNRPNCLTCHGEKFHAVIPASQMAPIQHDAACRNCHTDIAARLDASVHHRRSAADGQPAPTCLSCHGGGNPHAVAPAKNANRQQQVACIACHQDLSTSLQESVHNRPDKQPGDHPTCLTCHGTDAHGIMPPKHLSPIQKVQLCARCHADAQRMARYGRTDAVAAYEKTFHGRAILRFHQTKEATCVDCHGLHGIQSPDKPDAPTNPQHAAEICGKCHSGNRMDFAYSYASHLRLAVEESMVVPISAGMLVLLRLSPMLYFALLLVLGICYRCFRKSTVAVGWIADLYALFSLSGIAIALTALASLYAMHILDAAQSIRLIPSAIMLLLISVIAACLQKLLFRKSKPT